MKHLLIAAFSLACATAGQTAPYCPQLLSAETLPKKHQKRAPILSSTSSGWIIGQDQLKNKYGFDGETLALWQSIKDEFEKAGVTLVVLAAPPRPLFATQQELAELGHDRAQLFDTLGASFDAYIAGLNAAGILAPNLLTLAQSDSAAGYYFKRDTHWTPQGASKSVAQLHAMIAPSANPTEPSFNRVYSEKGSLSAIVKAVCTTRPEPETVPAATFPRAAGANALLTDTNGQSIALVGTSFSDRYQNDAYQVADAIAHFFDSDVSNYSVTGGGATGAMLGFIESGALASGNYDVVIWESPYTAPLVNPGVLRHVLGTLQRSPQAEPKHSVSGLISKDWTAFDIAFSSGAVSGMTISVPGYNAGQLSVELVSSNGEKYRMKLTKTDRLNASSRTDNWSVALTDLPNLEITRIKLRLSGGEDAREVKVITH